MSRSTFNGPVLIGVDAATSANASSIVTGPNWGFVNMVQSAPITQQTADTYPTYQKAADGTPGATNVPQMVIPGKSIITRISVLVTTAWEGDPAHGGGADGPGIDIGSGWGNLSESPPGTDKDIFVQAWDLDNLGMNVISPTGAFITGGFENWMNLSSVQQGDSVVGQDRFIALDSERNGDGVGVLTINYCQAVDLSAIA